jgi:hypothetical protein
MNWRVIIICSLLAACSSPPKPTPVELEKGAPIAVNAAIPRITPSTGVIASQAITGAWTYHITLRDLQQTPDPTAYYALAHSEVADVSAPSGAAWFEVRDWLLISGFHGVVHFHPALEGLTPVIHIELSRARSTTR